MKIKKKILQKPLRKKLVSKVQLKPNKIKKIPIENDAESKPDEFESHKESLAKLEETDPEFYQYLKDNDTKLLKFNNPDLSDDEDEEEEEVHKPTGELEVASDESDFEPDDGEETVNRKVTLKMLKTWQVNIQTDKSNKTIKCLVEAFHAAIIHVSAENEEETTCRFKVAGTAVFNGVIQLCVLELGPAVRKFLGLSSKQAPHKCRRFVKVKTALKSYFVDLLKLLGGVTSLNIVTVLLKHLHYMSPLLASFQKVCKPIVKKLIQIWGRAEETVRVIAFLCIVRIANNQPAQLDGVLRHMYMTYVRNSKFVSTNTLPGINFMRRSLVEMYALDVNVSYRHVFLYIRQLAIHLRNAITLHKREHIQAVYNWQFVNSLKLWGSLLASTYHKPQLQPLLYPFVQVALGTIKLIPTAQYFPLRFHIIEILTELSRETGVFIPILPFVLETLTLLDFNKRHKKVTMKPLDLGCLLRLSKLQLSENGCKDAIIDNVYDLMLEYLASQSHGIAFPDLTIFCIIQLKKFNSQCHVANYTKKMKQLIEKIKENVEFIENERKSIIFNLSDSKTINAWESNIKNKGTPIGKFHESWSQLRKIKKNKKATDNDNIGDYGFPVIKRIQKPGTSQQSGNEKEFSLFPSDDESDNEITFGEESEIKTKRGKRGGKNVKKLVSQVVNEPDDDNQNEQQDFVEDFQLSDW